MDSKILMFVAALAIASTGFMANYHSEATEVASAFESFKAKHGKSYATVEEEAYRFAVYVANIKMIKEHNESNASYTMAENQFADLTKAEFKAMYLGFKASEQKSENVHNGTPKGDGVNWVTAGKVQKVKDQGQCGSCWAFSTVASSESCDAIFGSGLGDFSEQQLVDCSGSYGNMGCNGGLMDQGFEYYIATKKYCTESSYPYTARDGSCKASQCTASGFEISTYTDVASGSTSALQSACEQQPISIAVDAEEWSFYSGGIFSNCGKSLDHGVLLAGYTSEYWLVKNSWGASWGEDGYIRLKSGNTCGLANSASYPSI